MFENVVRFLLHAFLLNNWNSLPSLALLFIPLCRRRPSSTDLWAEVPSSEQPRTQIFTFICFVFLSKILNLPKSLLYECKKKSISNDGACQTKEPRFNLQQNAGCWLLAPGDSPTCKSRWMCSEGLWGVAALQSGQAAMWTGSSATAFGPAGGAAAAKYTHHTWSEPTHNSQIAAPALVPRFLEASRGFCPCGRRSSLAKETRLWIHKWGGSQTIHPVHGTFTAFPGSMTAICAKLTAMSLECWIHKYILTNVNLSVAETSDLSRGHDQVSLSGSSPVGLQWCHLLIKPTVGHQWKTKGQSNSLLWTLFQVSSQWSDISQFKQSLALHTLDLVEAISFPHLD